MKHEVIDLDFATRVGGIFNDTTRVKAFIYTQEHLDGDIWLVNNILSLINENIFQAEDVLQSYQTLSLADPKDYTETSASPSGPRTEGETGSEVGRPMNSQSLKSGSVKWQPGSQRKLKVQGKLMAILEATAAELNTHEKLTDFSILIYSGGQPSVADEGAKETADRTGSARHDYGYGADIRCFKGGRRLSAWYDSDLELVKIIVKALFQNGIHSIGIGMPNSGYMNGDTHVDIATGNPDGYGEKVQRCVWGAGGHGYNAPAWLHQIYKENK